MAAFEEERDWGIDENDWGKVVALLSIEVVRQ